MQQVMSHISAIKKDMIVLEKSEFSTLRHEYEVRHMYQIKPVKLLQQLQVVDLTLIFCVTSRQAFICKFPGEIYLLSNSEV